MPAEHSLGMFYPIDDTLFMTRLVEHKLKQMFSVQDRQSFSITHVCMLALLRQHSTARS